MPGTLHHIKTSINNKYKLGIQDAYKAYESAHDNAISCSLDNKNPQEFLKAWQGS